MSADPSPLRFIIEECRDCWHVILDCIIDGAFNLGVPGYGVSKRFLDLVLWIAWEPTVTFDFGFPHVDNKSNPITYAKRDELKNQEKEVTNQHYAITELGETQRAGAKALVILSQTCQWLRALVLPYFKPIYETLAFFFEYDAYYKGLQCYTIPQNLPDQSYAYAVYGIVYNSNARAQKRVNFLNCKEARFTNAHYLVQQEDHTWALKHYVEVLSSDSVKYRIMEAFPRWILHRTVSDLLEAIAQHKEIIKNGKRILKLLKSVAHSSV